MLAIISASRIIFKDHELDKEECYYLPSATGLLLCQHLVPQKDLCHVNTQSKFRQFCSAEGKHYRPCHWSICLVFDVCYLKPDKKQTCRVHLND